MLADGKLQCFELDLKHINNCLQYLLYKECLSGLCNIIQEDDLFV